MYLVRNEFIGMQFVPSILHLRDQNYLNPQMFRKKLAGGQCPAKKSTVVQNKSINVYE